MSARAKRLAIAIGLGLVGLSLRQVIRTPLAPESKRLLSAGVSSLLLALPYFSTFFFSYSYHYRLGFAIVPLLCLPTALALAQILPPARVAAWRKSRRWLYHAALILLGAPGIAAVATDLNGSSLWLLNESLDSDVSKYRAFNPSLMEVVAGLEEDIGKSEDSADCAGAGRGSACPSSSRSCR